MIQTHATRPPASTLTVEDLISGAAADAGLTTEQGRAVMVGALGLLEKHATASKTDVVYAAVDGAEALAQSPEARPRGGGLFGGIMKGAGGVSGAAIADAMGLVSRLKKDGVDKDDLKRLLPAARDRVRAACGSDVLGDAVKSIPGVGPLLGAD